MAEGIIVGVSVGVVMMAINIFVTHRKERKSKDKGAIQLLLKCALVQLCALKKTGSVNGECAEVLEELNDFLISK